MEFLSKLKEDLNSLPPERKLVIQKIFSDLAEKLQRDEVIDESSLSLFKEPIKEIDNQRHLTLLKNPNEQSKEVDSESIYKIYDTYSEAETQYSSYGNITLFHLYLNFRAEKERLNNGDSLKWYSNKKMTNALILILITSLMFSTSFYLLTNKIFVILGALLMGSGTGCLILSWMWFYNSLNHMNKESIFMFKNSFLGFFNHEKPIRYSENEHPNNFYIPDLPIEDNGKIRKVIKGFYKSSEIKPFIDFKLKKNEAITIDELLFLNYYKR